MSYHLQAALARERHKTLLVEAEAFRLARLARTHQRNARDTARPARRWQAPWQLMRRAAPSTETPA